MFLQDIKLIDNNFIEGNTKSKHIPDASMCIFNFICNRGLNTNGWQKHFLPSALLAPQEGLEPPTN